MTETDVPSDDLSDIYEPGDEKVYIMLIAIIVISVVVGAILMNVIMSMMLK